MGIEVTAKGKAGLGAGLTLLVLAGCGFGNNNGPSLAPGLDNKGNMLPGEPRYTESGARIHQGDTVVIGAMYICLDKSGTVTIDDVRVVGAKGLVETGWALRPNPSWQPSPTTGRGQLGISRSTITKLQFPDTHTLDAKCGMQGQGYELGVEVRKTTSGEAGASAFVVTYTSGSDTKTYTFPRAFRLCNENSASAKTCEALKV